MEEARFTREAIGEILKNAAAGFSKNKVTKLSASLAYYTVFSLAPMLVVIIYLAGLFWSQNAIEGNLVHQLQRWIGSTPAALVQSIIKNASLNHKSSLLEAVIGLALLLIGATTVFSEMQSSLNYRWNLRLKKNTGIFELLLTRTVSFVIVVSLSFLLLASLVINTFLEGLKEKIQLMYPDIAIHLIYGTNLMITFVLTTILLAIIYKVLPNAGIRWKDVAAGLFLLLCFSCFQSLGSPCRSGKVT